ERGVGSNKKNSAKAKAKGKAGKATAPAMYQIFGAAGAPNIKVFHTCPISSDHDMATPFISACPPDLIASVFKMNPADVDAAPILADLEDFQKKLGSDLRFAAGKAQRPVPEGVSKKLGAVMLSMLNGMELLEVGKWQPLSTFATIKGHRSLQYEAGGFGTLRFCERLRDVVLISPEKVLGLLRELNNKKKEEERDQVSFGSALQFVCFASEEDLAPVWQHMYFGKLEAGQVLYTPAGMIADERVSPETDHVGLKVSTVAVGLTNGDGAGVQCLRKMQMEAKDLSKKNDVLDALLLAIDGKQSELKKAADAAKPGANPAP
ncbi:unnamed protein product, partial [Effrenium voratum]